MTKVPSLLEHVSAEAAMAWARNPASRLEATILPGIASWLLEVRGYGLLSEVPRVPGRRLPTLETWNLFVGPEEEDFRASQLARSLFMGDAVTAALKAADNNDASAWEEFVRRAEAGSPDLNFSMADERDGRTGERVELRMQDWVPAYFVREGRNLVPLAPMEEPGISHLTLEVEGDELLVTDWFRILRFNEALYGQDEHGVRRGFGGNINTTAGIEAEVAAHAERGLIHVFVGNTCPRILTTEDGLVVGHPLSDEDGEALEEELDGLPSVTTDLWWVTMAERSTLVRILGNLFGEEEAERRVRDYLDGPDGRHVERIPVRPGTKHLYFMGETESFQGKFPARSMQGAERMEPMFVLSDRPLDLDHDEEATPPSP